MIDAKARLRISLINRSLIQTIKAHQSMNKAFSFMDTRINALQRALRKIVDAQRHLISDQRDTHDAIVAMANILKDQEDRISALEGKAPMYERPEEEQNEREFDPTANADLRKPQ